MERKIRFVRNRTGAKSQAICQPGYQLLATMLESDIQDHATGTAIFNDINQALGKSTYETSGNSCSLLLDVENMVIIESLFDEEAPLVELEATEFLHYLKKWLEFLDTTTLLSLIP